jgi:hypothetical protein
VHELLLPDEVYEALSGPDHRAQQPRRLELAERLLERLKLRVIAA